MTIALVMLLVAIAPDDDPPRPTPTFSEFLAQLERGQIEDWVIIRTRDNSLRITPGRGRDYETGYVSDVGDELMTRLERGACGIRRRTGGRQWWVAYAAFIVLPIVLLMGFWLVLLRRSSGGNALGRFGRAPAKQQAPDSPKITFRDVAGVDEAVEELRVIEEFLEEYPKNFQALGAADSEGCAALRSAGYRQDAIVALRAVRG